MRPLPHPLRTASGPAIRFPAPWRITFPRGKTCTDILHGPWSAGTRAVIPFREAAAVDNLSPMILRIGTVPYLNAEPLVAALHDRERFPNVLLRSLVPSRLLAALLEGDLDAALVSAAGVLPERGLRILPAGCVAARGEVRSIRVFSRVPLEQVRCLALDASSRSGVALARLVFRCRYDADPDCVTMPPDLDAMLARADAAVLIGDPALRANE